MIRTGLIAFLGAALCAVLSIAAAQAQPLVPPAWVKDHIGQPGYVVLDLRDAGLYKVRHIVGAINRPYVNDEWRVRPLAGNNPPRTEQLFNARMAELGISNESHVVLIHAGRVPPDIQGAAHVYWHFKLLGHEKISIMNGGMVAYILEDAPLESLHRDAPDAADYKSKFNGAILARFTDVDATVAASGIFIDYRATAYFLGLSRLEGVARYCTIPGAKSLPADWVATDGGGALRPRDQLRKLYEWREIPFSLPHIAFSNTTERGALGWFIAHEILGNTRAQLYESSIREWAANPNNRMQRQVNLD